VADADGRMTDADLEAAIGRGQLEEVLASIRAHARLVPKLADLDPPIWSVPKEGGGLEVAFWETAPERAAREAAEAEAAARAKEAAETAAAAAAAKANGAK